MRMIKLLYFFALVILTRCLANSYPDLTPEAITVYRNPQFFKNLNYGTKVNYDEKPTKSPQGAHENYKYPGETKKPNPPPASPGFEVNYDNSPEFHHEPRDIFVDTTYKPSRRKGPYSPRYHNENNLERYPKHKKPPEVRESEDEEDNSGSREGVERNKSEPEPREFVSVLNEKPEEEFSKYHEPIHLAGLNSGFASSSYSKPYPLNRTSPILYEDWKFYNYPQFQSNKHLKSESSQIYSEEPPSNAFEADEPSSYYGRYDDETEDTANSFESEEFKNLGADTKHIYQKLLNPKKSILFKFHSKPKFKKLKLKLKKKKHLHNTDWFDEYPFNF